MKHEFGNSILAAPLRCGAAFRFVAILVAISTAATQPSRLARAAEIDLENWKLTLPVDVERTFEGKAAEISAAQLAAGYEDKYFLTESDGSIVFWCPVNGATTEDTEFPRSELREMLDARDPSVNWTSRGTHTLEARCRVMEVPSTGKVIIGQIHSYTGKSKPLVKLQYYKGRVEALVKMSPNAGKDRKLTFPEVGLSGDIAYQIKLRDGVLSITVNGATQTENIVENDGDWANQTFYFKAGAYTQDNEGDDSEGARVVFSMLNVGHG